MNRERTFRPSFSESQLESLTQFLYSQKTELQQKFENGDRTVENNLLLIADLFANFLGLLHGKAVGRRRHLQGSNPWRDDTMIYFNLVKAEWLKSLRKAPEGKETATKK